MPGGVACSAGQECARLYDSDVRNADRRGAGRGISRTRKNINKPRKNREGKYFKKKKTVKAYILIISNFLFQRVKLPDGKLSMD